MPTAQPEAAETPATVPQPRGKLIAIDPGHGGRDPGAVHETGSEVTITESEANLAISLKLAEMLRNDGYGVRLIRTDAGTPVPGSKARDLQARIDLANESNADLLILVHNNGHENRSLRGSEVWYCESRPFSDDNRLLATEAQRGIVANVRAAGYDTIDRGIKECERMGHFALTGPHSLRPSRMPGVLGESLFLTNDEDTAQLRRPEIQEAIARGYLQGIEAFFAQQA